MIYRPTELCWLFIYILIMWQHNRMRTSKLKSTISEVKNVYVFQLLILLWNWMQITKHYINYGIKWRAQWNMNNEISLYAHQYFIKWCGMLWNTELYFMFQCVKKKLRCIWVKLNANAIYACLILTRISPRRIGYGSLEYIPAGHVCHRLYNYVYLGTVYGTMSMYFTFFGMGSHNVIW